MKKILAINYSQSGQLDEIIDNFVSQLQNVVIDRVKIKPEKAYPFPWQTDNFYDCMPETVLEETIPLESIPFKESKYDLIILGYQPWFLSPSLPTTSILKDDTFKKLMKDTPIITVIGARNMWLNAQASMVNLISEGDGHLVGNIAFVDRAPNQLSAISIVHWMMTGKKTRKWGIFPLPGISQEDIDGSRKFGKILNESLEINQLDNFQESVIKNDGLRIKTSILFIEGKAKKIFLIWANIIKKKVEQGKKKAFWIQFFRYYLNFALFIVAPILLLFYSIFIRPFTLFKIAEKKKHFAYLGIK